MYLKSYSHIEYFTVVLAFVGGLLSYRCVNGHPSGDESCETLAARPVRARKTLRWGVSPVPEMGHEVLILEPGFYSWSILDRLQVRPWVNVILVIYLFGGRNLHGHYNTPLSHSPSCTRDLRLL